MVLYLNEGILCTHTDWRFIMAFVSFMSSAAGRILRIVVGLGLIGWGVYLAVAANNMTTGIILAVVGLLPLVAGLFESPEVAFFRTSLLFSILRMVSAPREMRPRRCTMRLTRTLYISFLSC